MPLAQPAKFDEKYYADLFAKKLTNPNNPGYREALNFFKANPHLSDALKPYHWCCPFCTFEHTLLESLSRKSCALCGGKREEAKLSPSFSRDIISQGTGAAKVVLGEKGDGVSQALEFFDRHPGLWDHLVKMRLI